jgi:hypothetical protein
MNTKQPVAKLAKPDSDESIHARQPDETDESWVDDPREQEKWAKIGAARNELNRGVK